MKKVRDWLKRNAALLLWIGIALFVGFTLGAVGLGAPYKDQLGTGFEYWLNRYQTALSIIVAVLIAKHQLAAGRSEHVANVKIAFRHELESLQTAEDIASRYTFYVMLLDNSVYTPDPITQSELSIIKKSNSTAVFNAVKLLVDILSGDKVYPCNSTKILRMPGAHRVIEEAMNRDDYKAAKAIETEVLRRKDFLRQFMPDL